MNKQNIGFAFLLLGLIFAIAQEAIFWWTGVLMGIIGFVIVIVNSKK
jgi:predicted cobalt transporter CbtA